MSKIVLGALVRYLVTLLIGFFVARHMLSEDVARKLNAGDTVELWGGAWTVNVKQIVDFVCIAVVPMLVPLLLGLRARVHDKYKLLIARLSPATLSVKQIDAQVAATPATAMIKAVSNEQPPVEILYKANPPAA